MLHVFNHPTHTSKDKVQTHYHCMQKSFMTQTLLPPLVSSQHLPLCPSHIELLAASACTPLLFCGENHPYQSHYVPILPLGLKSRFSMMTCLGSMTSLARTDHCLLFI